MLPLQTERLLLRPPEMADAPVVANLVGNWNVARWLAQVPFPYALADAEAFIVDRLTLPPSMVGTVAVIARDAQPIGMIGIEPRRCGMELGYWLGESYWGNGYMTEAAMAFTQGYFDDSRAVDLQCGYIEGNDGSARVLTKLGFEIVGRNTIFSRSNGRDMPDVNLRLTRARFRMMQT